MKRSILTVVSLLAVVLPVALVPTAVGAQNSDDDAATYTVVYRNISSGQYLTPPNFAAHTDDVDLFQRGTPASAGVQAVAENGAVPVLAAEFAAAVDDAGLGVSGVGADAPIGPGESVEFEFTTSADNLTVVSMIICTNDGFAGLDSKRLPGRDGLSLNYVLGSFDAGTERNTEMRSDLVPAPFCGPGDGTTESNPDLAVDSVIRRHRTLQGVGDLDPSLDWEGAVASLTVTREEPPTYTITYENISSGQYLTPPNYVAHSGRHEVFQRGTQASAGVQAVAENGDVPTLAAELLANFDEPGLGVSGVGGETPIGPGESITFEVTSGQRRLSIVSMIICTNDGFAGLDGQRLPGRDGRTRTHELQDYDAGTERNTELRADLVPAPFCGPGDGTTMSDPAIAIDGRIRRHPTLRGVGDLDPSLDWTGNVARVTITRN